VTSLTSANLTAAYSTGVATTSRLQVKK